MSAVARQTEPQAAEPKSPPILEHLQELRPLLVMGLAKLGVVQSRTLWRWWRFALVGAFILSAIVTPSIDPITQTLVALPMIVLYFVGIGLARLVESSPIIPRA